jgi:CRP-like cAMP-binding protein
MALANHVLSHLSQDDLALLQPHLEPVELAFRKNLEEPNEAIKFAYFPDDGIVSIVANGGRGRMIEVGVIGRDGMTAQPVVMGTDRSANSTFVQVAGTAHRIEVAALRKAMDRSPTLRRSLLMVVQAFLTQAAHTALANGTGKIEERAARWLVMAHDRLTGDGLPLTHEFLAIMLGVRRAGVTVSLKNLETLGLISTKRKVIEVRNRAGLVKLAADIYGVPEAEQTRLTGWRSLKFSR